MKGKKKLKGQEHQLCYTMTMLWLHYYTIVFVLLLHLKILDEVLTLAG